MEEMLVLLRMLLVIGGVVVSLSLWRGDNIKELSMRSLLVVGLIV
jgi:hypothetical protein